MLLFHLYHIWVGNWIGRGMKVRIEKQLNFKSIFQQFCKLSAWAPGRVEKVSLSSYPPASSYSCWCCLVQHWKQAIIDKALNMNSEWCQINKVPPNYRILLLTPATLEKLEPPYKFDYVPAYAKCMLNLVYRETEKYQNGHKNNTTWTPSWMALTFI